MRRENDPEQFAELHPNDPWLLEAQRRGSELAEITSPQRDDETPLDAKRRVEQGFDLLETDLSDDLAKYHQGERDRFRKDFLERGREEINARYQPSLDRTPDLQRRQGGQFARDEEKRLFEERLSSNPDYQAKGQALRDEHTGRETAVTNAIGEARDATLLRLGLDKVQEPRQALPSGPEKGGNALQIPAADTMEKAADRQAVKDDVTRRMEELRRERER